MVTFNNKGWTIRREVNKGCPHESSLGFLLWNIFFDLIVGIDDHKSQRRHWRPHRSQQQSRVREDFKTGVKQDQEEVHQHQVGGSTREDALHPAKGPIIKCSGECVGVVDELWYLGVVLERGLTFGKLSREVVERAKPLFYKNHRLVG